jgi:hypothetical protein
MDGGGRNPTTEHPIVAKRGPGQMDFYPERGYGVTITLHGVFQDRGQNRANPPLSRGRSGILPDAENRHLACRAVINHGAGESTS